MKKRFLFSLVAAIVAIAGGIAAKNFVRQNDSFFAMNLEEQYYAFMIRSLNA